MQVFTSLYFDLDINPYKLNQLSKIGINMALN